MVATTKPERKSTRDIAYYTQRYRNRVHAKLVSFVGDQLEKHGLAKKDLAEILNREPSQISRWLSQPSNLGLDTISMFALAFDAEPEPPEFIFFSERTAPNYIHPLVAKAANLKAVPIQSTLSLGSSGTRVQTTNSIDFKPISITYVGST